MRLEDVEPKLRHLAELLRAGLEKAERDEKHAALHLTAAAVQVLDELDDALAAS